MTAMRLAELARAAELSEYHLRTLRYLARPWAAQRPYDPIKFDDTQLPKWEIQVLGAVRRTSRAALEFLDALDAMDLQARIEGGRE